MKLIGYYFKNTKLIDIVKNEIINVSLQIFPKYGTISKSGPYFADHGQDVLRVENLKVKFFIGSKLHLSDSKACCKSRYLAPKL